MPANNTTISGCTKYRLITFLEVNPIRYMYNQHKIDKDTAIFLIVFTVTKLLLIQLIYLLYFLLKEPIYEGYSEIISMLSISFILTGRLRAFTSCH